MFQPKVIERQLPSPLATFARFYLLIVNHLVRSLTRLRARGALETAVTWFRVQNLRFRAYLVAGAVRMHAWGIGSRPYLAAAGGHIRAQLAEVDSRLAATAARVRARLAPHAKAAIIRLTAREFRVAAVPYLAIGLLSVAAGLMIATAV